MYWLVWYVPMFVWLFALLDSHLDTPGSLLVVVRGPWSAVTARADRSALR